ncbi:efflux RND transporter periplasmic adaptor subunit [Bacillus sp. 03113]|uniref:efflux RND transporter periplasmic adaptor subunit n=1 Tax=Bacillus sp. 03113 TaxID=2578211 RepID=UPI00114210B9|nr:efflux RND transporter periplasmic adaptor subunit [Bacillus sp. 03113]
MKWKNIAISLVILLFLGVNLFLFIKENNKIKQSFYIKSWTSVKQQRLLETFPTTAVAIPAEKQSIYFDSKNGAFKDFLVQKGEEVDEGTPLFEYSAASIEQRQKQLQADLSELEQELTSMETNIDRLYELQSTIESDSYSEEDLSSYLSEDEDSEDVSSILTQSTPSDSSSKVLSVSIEQDIYEKEQQKEKIEAKIAKYEELLSGADEDLSNLAVESELSGIVQEMKEDLNNPVITIVSKEQKLEGTLSEYNRPKIVEGMNVLVTYENNKQIKGTIEQVSKTPVQKPNVKKESKYPFTVLLEDQRDNLVQGTHLGIKIITNEVDDAITIPAESMKKENKNHLVYVLKSGKVEKRKIETGMTLKKVQQVSKGVKQDEKIVHTMPISVKDDHPFFTKLKIKQWDKKTVKSLSKKQIAILIGKGFLAK